MKYTSQGCLYSVRVTRAEVESFKRSYPCSGLPDRAITFQFDRRNGDLVDISPDSTAFDGPGLLALSEDAQKYGEKESSDELLRKTVIYAREVTSMKEYGYLQHGHAPEPCRTERIEVKHEYADRYLARFEGKWRRVFVDVGRTYICFQGEKITIQIDGL